ncbi:MAG: STAS domain-containing protein [Rhodospirillaceae bacterium]|nr:STAS domain-containing protein [Rhodospirillaceae bacterium]
MNIDIQDNHGTREIIVSGQMSFGDNVEFRSIVEGIKSDSLKTCKFNVKDLESIDSAGLGMLVLAKEVATEHGTEMIIQSPRGQVKKMLDITKFGELITIIE